MEGREWEELGPNSNGRDKKGREAGREREKKGRGASCPKIKSRSRALASKHQFGRGVKCYRRHGSNGIRHKADSQTANSKAISAN